jgi:hypothetical protein
MADSESLKRQIRDCISSASPEGELASQDFERLQQLVEQIAAHSTYVPAERQDIVAGNWQTAFASFGAKHSAGKSRAHESNLAIQSFNHLPSAPIRVTDIRQEIDHSSRTYSNVILFTPPNGGTEAAMILHGRYAIDPELPHRFHVAFERAELRALDGSGNVAALRHVVGLPPEAATDVTFAPPKLWSDIIYVDEDLRINKGNFGGLYVVERCDLPMMSAPS